MNISLLSKMIRELLLEHDEVGLPGLGAFVAEFVPASFTDRGYVINPPYRRVVFLPGKGAAGRLIALYARVSGLDEGQVRQVLERFLAELKAELIEKKTVVFPGLGRLRATRQNNFFFISDEDLDIYPEGFALESVSLKNHTVIPAPEPVELEPVVIDAEPFPEPAIEPVVEDPIPAPEPEPLPEPEVEPLPEPVAEEPLPEPEPEPEPEPVIEIEPEGGESLPATQAKPSREPAQAPEKLRRRFKWWIPVTALLLISSILLASFLILAQAAPDFIDSILYTPEELRILNW